MTKARYIGDFLVRSNNLSNTGVTASTYGNATIIPVITVGADGRLSSVSNVTITATVTGGASATVQNTAPGAATDGTFWLDSDTMDLYVSYSNAWVLVNGSSAPTDVISPLLLSGM